MAVPLFHPKGTPLISGIICPARIADFSEWRCTRKSAPLRESLGGSMKAAIEVKAHGRALMRDRCCAATSADAILVWWNKKDASSDDGAPCP